ncbi:hypothetical protein EC991_009470 [Linnemannia zychae]|nr:hypothetical protein EC991_009470 [Linnemannia zychae]
MGPMTTLYADDSFWYSFYQTIAYRFNIQMGTWDSTSSSVSISVKDYLPAFADPATNQIYILNGYTLNGGIGGTVRFDLNKNEFSYGPQTSTLTGGFTAVWSKKNSAAIISGGYTLGSKFERNPQKTIYTFKPNLDDGDRIQNAMDSGESPPARFDHCMVEAYNGTKMILFGGTDDTGRSFDDIYFLDVATLRWAKGTPGGPTAARYRASCAVTNDYFVVWGGVVSSSTSTMTAVSQNVTLVYNLVANQWVDSYSPGPYVPPPPSPAVTTGTGTGTVIGTVPGPNPTGTDTDTGSNGTPGLRWIIGGGVGGLAVVGVIVGLFIFYRRQQSSKNKTTAVDKDHLYRNRDNSSSDQSFVSSRIDSGPIDKPVPIDYHQQTRQPQYTREQNEQDRRRVRSPQALNIHTSPVIISTKSGASNSWPNYQSAAHSLHTSIDTQGLPDIPNPKRYLSITNNAWDVDHTPNLKRYPHISNDSSVFASIPSPERHPYFCQQ